MGRDFKTDHILSFQRHDSDFLNKDIKQFLKMLGAELSLKPNSPAQIFKLSNHFLVINDKAEKWILTVMHNRFLEHFLSNYNRKFESLFLVTEDYSYGNLSQRIERQSSSRSGFEKGNYLAHSNIKGERTVPVEALKNSDFRVDLASLQANSEASKPKSRHIPSAKDTDNTIQTQNKNDEQRPNTDQMSVSKELKQKIDRIKMVKRTDLKNPNDMRVFFATNMRSLRGSQASKRNPPREKRKPSLNTTQQNSSQTYQSDGDSFYRRQKSGGEDIHQENNQESLFNGETPNLKYHRNILKNIESDDLDEYIYSKNHSLNNGKSRSTIEDCITFVTYFDVMFNIQKNTQNLNIFLNHFSLQVET